MKNTLLGAGAAMLMLAAGCTTLTAPEEVKALKEAGDTFSTAIQGAEEARVSGLDARNRENARSDVADGGIVAFNTDCADRADAWNRDLNRLVGATPYDWQGFDTAYQRRRALSACELSGVDRLPGAAPPLDPSLATPEHVMSVDASTLPRAAANLKAYVTALSDIATGESAAKVDAARGAVATAAQGLAGALGGNDSTDAVIGLINRAVGALIAARRNAATREFLNGVDAAMPDLMERMGRAARLATADALLSRAVAAQSVAVRGNRVLNPPSRFAAPYGGSTPERLELLDGIAARLETHNAAFRQLRVADPMAAARAFAKAHRELTAVFNDPRRNRIALAAALAGLKESADALAKALDDADGEEE